MVDMGERRANELLNSNPLGHHSLSSLFSHTFFLIVQHPQQCEMSQGFSKPLRAQHHIVIAFKYDLERSLSRDTKVTISYLKQSITSFDLKVLFTVMHISVGTLKFHSLGISHIIETHRDVRNKLKKGSQKQVLHHKRENYQVLEKYKCCKLCFIYCFQE